MVYPPLLRLLVNLACVSIILISGHADQVQLIAPCESHVRNFPRIACVHRYASVMPGDFKRQVDIKHGEDTFYSTSVSADPTFAALGNATFVVWDKKHGLDLLGSNPHFEVMFHTNFSHEAPVYVPDTNELWFSSVAQGHAAINIIDLNLSPPHLSEVKLDPPILNPVGARYRKGKVYLAAAGGSSSLDGGPYRPGIYSVDPRTRKSTTVVNNYYGYYFSTVDDLDLDLQGNIWFTDPMTGRNIGLNTEAPQMQASTYRFDIATGAVNLVDDTLIFPNGITFSPDRRQLYISDTASGVPNIDPTITAEQAGPLRYNTTNPRTIYAFTVSKDGTHLVGRRPLYTALEYVPDGLKVASNGYIVTSTGHGVDILDTNGIPLLRIQTPFISVNTAFAGKSLDELWIVGREAIARVKIHLKDRSPF